ncbi:DNA recombination protein RmuC [Corynebacterium phocae]|uniref:DNA recombination protein RmuC n=1 Tax=Corynebacterium phocae TaxID=161895 RepID=UPI0009521A8F|nr:DNA recombination protein RmuC [Corynebacterium phocae]KAA8723157.1 DNA recombination protein RmuC [Corynebacterium phocae]
MELLFLFTGLAIGVALGWYACSAHAPQPAAAPTPALPPPVDIAPLEKALDRMAYQMQEIEAGRSVEINTLGAQIQSITRTSARIGDRTDQLLTALRSPNVRGRWGEVQLERVVELGGMVKHVDFNPQTTAYIDGRAVRPDLLINLSGGRHIVVDAKVPFSSYIDAIEAQDPEENLALMRRHARLVRGHVQTLSSKDYTAAFNPTPEFVVLFVPADPFLDAALNVDPELLEFAFQRGVVIATPASLFALLRTVALGWSQEDASQKASEIQRLGQELYSRLNTMGDHYNRVGRSLEKAIEAFNSTLASVDSRVMVSARKLSEMEIGSQNRHPTELKPVDIRPRQAPNSEHHAKQDYRPDGHCGGAHSKTASEDSWNGKTSFG